MRNDPQDTYHGKIFELFRKKGEYGKLSEVRQIAYKGMKIKVMLTFSLLKLDYIENVLRKIENNLNS